MSISLLFVRHADAGDREDFALTGKPDKLRPISERGVRQMDEVSSALTRLQPECELILTSPYTRALQTAQILSKAWDTPIRESSSLEPESDLPKFLEELSESGSLGVIAAVGHEPHLGMLVGWLLSGSKKTSIEFAKGGACLLRFESAPKPGSARLRWFVGPKHLARLRK